MKENATKLHALPGFAICPHCLHPHNQGWVPTDQPNYSEGRTPRRGDVFVCLNCAGLALYDVEAAAPTTAGIPLLRPIPPDLVALLMATPVGAGIRRLQDAIRAAKANHEGPGPI